MTPEDLLRDLRKKELEVNVMKSIIEQKEREFLKRERQLRDELNEVLTSTREEEKNFSEEKVRMKEKYYEQRVKFCFYFTFLFFFQYFHISSVAAS